MMSLLTALRAAAETTRLRILSALRNSELTVSELVDILQQSQPRVSRHLKVLCNSGLLQRYQEGAWVFYRVTDSGEMAKVARGIIKMIDINDPDLLEDQTKLQHIKSRNAKIASEYFRKNASDWDSIRKMAVPDTDIEKKLIDCLATENPALFLDLGTGTGRILEIFSPHIQKGVGIDLSREMLVVARSNLDSNGVTNCSVRQGDITNLAFEDNSIDVITIHQVLHYLDRPDHVIAEASRVLKSDGQLIIVDFLPHELEFLREKHAHRRLGISEKSIKKWAKDFGLKLLNSAHLSSENKNANALSVGLWDLRK